MILNNSFNTLKKDILEIRVIGWLYLTGWPEIEKI